MIFKSSLRSLRKSIMGVLEFIEKLQKKPEVSRKKIAALTTLAIMIFIIAIWLVALSFPSAKKETREAKGPFESLKEDFLNFYGIVKENIGRIK